MKITSSMLLNIILLTIISASFFLVNTTASNYGTRSTGYDPWIDSDDDGDIDLYDAVRLLTIYGSKGTPINKTALLLELQSRIEALEERTPKFYSVFQWRTINTTATDWVDMDGVSVTISLNHTSHLLIICTLHAATDPVERAMFLRALVGTEIATPFEYQLFCVTSPSTTTTVSYYQMSVASGRHTVKIQWRMNPVIPATGWAGRIALTVIALPA